MPAALLVLCVAEKATCLPWVIKSYPLIKPSPLTVSIVLL
jgi:hypothetical protein